MTSATAMTIRTRRVIVITSGAQCEHRYNRRAAGVRRSPRPVPGIRSGARNVKLHYCNTTERRESGRFDNRPESGELGTASSS